MINTSRILAPLVALLLTCAPNGKCAVGDDPGDLPHTVKVELGKSQFAPGDSITITQIHGTSEKIEVGGTYCVEGKYTLSSSDEADLCLFATTIGESGPTPIDDRQRVSVTKGTGTFRLVKTMGEDGHLHLSFYPHDGGETIGGIYFGQGDRVYRKETSNTSSQSHSDAAPASVTGPNRALLEYLGKPVEPPAKLDARYTKEGLIKAVELAASNAGITPKKLVIEDSEFPFLGCVVCGRAEWPKLKDQMRKLEGYEYRGAVGNDTCNAFNIVPYNTWPPDAFQRISRRLMLREQVLYDQNVVH